MREVKKQPHSLANKLSACVLSLMRHSQQAESSEVEPLFSLRLHCLLYSVVLGPMSAWARCLYCTESAVIMV